MNKIESIVNNFTNNTTFLNIKIEKQVEMVFQSIKVDFLDKILTILTFGIYYKCFYEPVKRKLIEQVIIKTLNPTRTPETLKPTFVTVIVNTNKLYSIPI